MNKLLFPNIILIAGQSQNVGKSTLACNIIQRFSSYQDVYSIKTTPHFHKSVDSARDLERTGNYALLEEKNPEGNKDTSRMLKSGAKQSFLIMTKPDGILDGLISCVNKMPKNALIVCESGELINHITPGVFLFLRQLNCQLCKVDEDNRFSLADRIVTFTMNGFDFSASELEISENKWILKNT